jgi:hypothetical protein
MEMKEYHKIQSVFKRDSNTHRFIEGEWSLPEFDYLKNNNWVWTEKVDGTNIRVGWDGYAIDFNGRTKDAQTPKFLKLALQDLFTPKASVFKEIFDSDDVCLYGEGYGAKIQKGGGNYRSDNSFVLFDVLIGGVWLKRESVEDIADKLDLEIVPIIGIGTLLEAIDFARTPFYSTWGPFHAEGLVCRPEVELKTRLGNRVITKVKTKDWK